MHHTAEQKERGHSIYTNDAMDSVATYNEGIMGEYFNEEVPAFTEKKKIRTTFELY